MTRLALVLALVFASCSSPPSSTPGASASSRAPQTQAAPPPGEGQAVAIFAGGCFWCMERPFEDLPGVISVLSGYTGGELEGPSYDEVSAGRTGHAEAVRVLYDPSRITYEQLLEVFWHNVDPTQADAQFCDHGTQYRSGIFPIDAEQRRLAEASKARVEQTIPGRIVTEITDAGPFWIAEDYHQDFYRTHPVRYTEYRLGCGRDARLQQIWGDLAGGH
ncbi:peptide-methionine (S)-S-oxide reductase MsrA [Sandaracinus amylolyticus]|uniref:peptide-methionine (S)-S-oxide reductase MsrA n=1 Tax=Sandaracinus amylolyticus TaxID=927083 RepID=UPI001F351FE0|nr:peptide-methionine (S)-S-oxide reductase MsrA [Sandaracinus amylolyticus]UJR78246.1 Peptide methionine sulfoxide reductase MsrA [Sandaracinus amylolyticus]